MWHDERAILIILAYHEMNAYRKHCIDLIVFRCKMGARKSSKQRKKLPINQVLVGDCIEVMNTFPPESIDMVMFSPPYWGFKGLSC